MSSHDNGRIDLGNNSSSRVDMTTSSNSSTSPNENYRTLPKYLKDDMQPQLPKKRARMSQKSAEPSSNGNGSTSKQTADHAKMHKVSKACVYCQRSHMTCDESRPCKRCVSRKIPQLCHDRPSLPTGRPRKAKGATDKASTTKSQESPEDNGQMVEGTQTISPTHRWSNESMPDFVPNDSPPQGTMSSENNAVLLALGNRMIPSPPEGYVDWISRNSTGNYIGQSFGQDQLGTNQQTMAPQQMMTSQQAMNPQQTMATPQMTNSQQGLPSQSTMEVSPYQQLNNLYQSDTQMSSSANDRDRRPSVDLLWGLVDYPQLHNSINLEGFDFSFPGFSPTDGFAMLDGNASDQSLNPLRRTSSNELVSSNTLTGQYGMENFVATTPKTAKPISRVPTPAISFLRGQTTTDQDQDGEGGDPWLVEIQPWNYTYSYARMNRFINRHWSQSSNDRTTAVISILRPHFLAIIHQRDDEEIKLQEATFRNTVVRYERDVFELCSAPTLVWRRTGDIVAGNEAFANLIGIKARALQRVSKLYVYELLDEESCVRMFEDYGELCYPRKNWSGEGQPPKPPAITSTYTLKAPTGSGATEARHIRCATSLNVIMDDWGVPIVVVCSFIPIGG